MEIGKLDIPENSGVYLMKKNNKVIYVGKAKNLKNRVLSYFNTVHENEKTNELVKNIEDIDFFITNSEVDALLLENNLIKKYSPKYNIALKDEKTYPYIKISKEKFPSIKIIRTTRSLNLKDGEYFGPYPYGASRLKNILTKLFKIRDCNRDMNKISSRPCLKYYMKNCTAPCVYKNISDEYYLSIENIRKVLRGNSSKLIEELKTKMNESANNMDFERAITYREQINEIEGINSSQIIQFNRELDEDIFVFERKQDKVFICVLNLREGKVIGKSSTILDLKNKLYDNLFEEILLRYYSKHSLPKSVVLEEKYKESLRNAIEVLQKQNKEKKEFYFPVIKSRRKNLLEMAYKNLERDLENYYSKKEIIEKGIKDIYYKLDLKRFPLKIECFDISNIQGKDAVASMSVSVEGRPSKKDYRRFKIRCKDTPDDFSMMREVIKRRYSKLDKKDFPDVILIDGGLGQINSAGEILNEINKLGISELLSLAKRDEEIYKYGENEPYRLSKDDEALKIFQRVRDEAHRFGITYHRKLRSKRIISSELDNIDGVGEKRKKELLKKFGSVSVIKTTSLEDLKTCVPEKVARNIKKYFE